MTGANDRFAAIAGGGLKRRTNIVAVPTSAQEDVESANDTERSATSTRGAAVAPKARKGERTTPHSSETGGNRRVSFRVPEATDASLRARVRDDDTSKVHVILDAIEHVVASKAELTFNSADNTDTTSALFVRPRTPTTATPTVQTDIILDARSLATVDKLVKDYSAPTRTAFVLACLDEYL